MKKSTIHFTVELDQHNIPERIQWDATDKPQDTPSETKSISISLWDSIQKNTMRIDLWTKDMPVDDMKRFYIECLGGLAQSALSSTNDERFANEIQGVCDRLVEIIRKEK
jgi:gliding motility-associated protein GldC